MKNGELPFDVIICRAAKFFILHSSFLIKKKKRGLSQLSRINEICVFCVNPRSGICSLPEEELISCQQQRQHLSQHESA